MVSANVPRQHGRRRDETRLIETARKTKVMFSWMLGSSNKFAQTGRLEKLPTRQIGASQIAVPAAPAGAHASPKAGAAAVSGAHLDADPDHAHHERP